MIIPTDMDVPASRRDTSRLENVLWLQRNLAIRNLAHPLFQETMHAIRKELRKWR